MRVEVVAGLEGERQQQIRLASDPGESRGQHAHHGVRLPVDGERAPDHARIGPETGPPQAVAEERHPMRAPALVIERECAAERRSDSEDAEHLRRSDDGAYALRLLRARDVHRLAVHRRHPREGAARLAHAVEIGRRETELGVRIALDRRDPHQAVRVRIGQWPQQYGPGHAEHRAVRADAERQREDRNRGEGGRLEKHAQAKPQIGEERLHPARCPQTPCRPGKLEEARPARESSRGVSAAGTAPSASGADFIVRFRNLY